MLVVHGDKDTVIQQPEVDMLLTAYPAAELVTVPDADHGYGFYSDQPEVTETGRRLVRDVLQRELEVRVASPRW